MKGFTPNPDRSNSGFEAYKEIVAEAVDKKLLNEVQIVDDYTTELQEDKIRMFWCHDIPNNPDTHVFADREWLSRFHKIIFTSNWQLQAFEEAYNLPHDLKTMVIENGFNPAPAHSLEKPQKRINIIYTGSPSRGLDILVPVMEYFIKENNNLHLHIFCPDINEEGYGKLFDHIQKTDNMHLHANYTRNDFLNILSTCHIFVLPSDYKQMSGRALIEAMSAGCVCVHPNTNNLPEITGSLNVMYQSDMSDPKIHAGIFAGNLNAAIDMIEKGEHKGLVRFNKAYVDSRYNIDFIKNKWSAIIKRLMQEYPDPVSRKFKSETFLYSVKEDA